MKYFIRRTVFALALLIAAMLAQSSVSAATIFESGTLGPTGVTTSDLINGTTPGTSIDFTVYAGVRFQPALSEKKSLTGIH